MDKLAINKPGELMTQLREFKTPALCAASGTPALAEIKKEHGMDKAMNIVQIWISNCNDFFNLPRKMSPAQIKETATMIMDDYYYLKIADINLVFTRAKKGYYGEMYQSLDGMKVYSWFTKYADERANEIFNDNLKNHNITKSQE